MDREEKIRRLSLLVGKVKLVYLETNSSWYSYLYILKDKKIQPLQHLKRLEGEFILMAMSDRFLYQITMQDILDICPAENTIVLENITIASMLLKNGS